MSWHMCRHRTTSPARKQPPARQHTSTRYALAAAGGEPPYDSSFDEADDMELEEMISELAEAGAVATQLFWQRLDRIEAKLDMLIEKGDGS